MLLDLSGLPLWAVAAVLAGTALVICFSGTRLAGLADELADRTGMGEIVAGAVFVGASTSLPGVITSVSTAAQGYAGLAIGNALGGLTALPQGQSRARRRLGHRAHPGHAPGLPAHHPAARDVGAADHLLRRSPGLDRAVHRLGLRPAAAGAGAGGTDVVAGQDQANPG